ncbi:hypothetical protein ACWGOQ_0002490 [Aquimarina sp. M1]
MGDFEEALRSHSDEVIGFGRDLSLNIGDNPTIEEDFKPSISYDLLSYKVEREICLTSENFTKEDFHLYFEKMIEVSKTRLGDLLDGNTNLDFKIYTGANKKLKEIFFKSIGVSRTPESTPSFGRIGLYNSKSGVEKAPRIFFVVGHYAKLHILAFDPEHKIYGIK